MTAWSSGLPQCVLVVLFALLPHLTSAAPLSDQPSNNESIYPVADSTGCYYNYQHYDEGDRIITNEPCLNCTCHRQMLMCYLRVCPYTKAIGQDCTVEKRPDQCCPVITCPEVPVQLIPSSTPSTALGHLNEYGCFIDSLFYSDGARVPSNPNNPCELCYCIRNRTACVMQECTLNIEGCKPVYQEGVCCPVKYDCDHPEQNLLESTTTEVPQLTFTTTLSPENAVCLHNNEIYADGALIEKDQPCHHCYCMKGKIVCAVLECSPTPLDKVNCTAVPPREGECCTDTYDCDNIIEHQLTTMYNEYSTTALPGLSQTTGLVNQDENEIVPTVPSATENAQTEEPRVPEKESTVIPETQEVPQSSTEQVEHETPSVEEGTQGIPSSSESNEIPEVYSTTPKITESPSQTEEAPKLDISTKHPEQEVTESVVSAETKLPTEADKISPITESVEQQTTASSAGEHLTTEKSEEEGSTPYVTEKASETEQSAVTDGSDIYSPVTEKEKGVETPVTEKESGEVPIVTEGSVMYNPVTEEVEPNTEQYVTSTDEDVPSGTEAATEKQEIPSPATETVPEKQPESTSAPVTEVHLTDSTGTPLVTVTEHITPVQTESPVDVHTEGPKEAEVTQTSEVHSSEQPSIEPETEKQAVSTETPVKEEPVTLGESTEKLPTEGVIIEEHPTTEAVDKVDKEQTSPENVVTESQPNLTETSSHLPTEVPMVVTEEVVTSSANIPIESHVNEKITESTEHSTNAVTEEYVPSQETTNVHEGSSTESVVTKDQTNQIIPEDHTEPSKHVSETTVKPEVPVTEQTHLTTIQEEIKPDQVSTEHASTEQVPTEHVPSIEHISTEQPQIVETTISGVTPSSESGEVSQEPATTAASQSEELPKVTEGHGTIVTEKESPVTEQIPSVTEKIDQPTVSENEITVTEGLPQVTEQIETQKPELVTEHLPTEPVNAATEATQVPEKSATEPPVTPEKEHETEIPQVGTESVKEPEVSITEQTPIVPDKEHETEIPQVGTESVKEPEKSATEGTPVVPEKEHETEIPQVVTESVKEPEISATQGTPVVPEKEHETEIPQVGTESVKEPEISATEATPVVPEKEHETEIPQVGTESVKEPEISATEATPVVPEKEHETEIPQVSTESVKEPEKSATEETPVVPEKEHETEIPQVSTESVKEPEISGTEETPVVPEKEHETEIPQVSTESVKEPEISATEGTPVVPEKEHETEIPQVVTESVKEPDISATEGTPVVPEKEHETGIPQVGTESVKEPEISATEGTPVVPEKEHETEIPQISTESVKEPEKSATEETPVVPEKEFETGLPQIVTESVKEPEKSATEETPIVPEKQPETEVPQVGTESVKEPEKSATDETPVIPEKETEKPQLSTISPENVPEVTRKPSEVDNEVTNAPEVPVSEQVPTTSQPTVEEHPTEHTSTAHPVQESTEKSPEVEQSSSIPEEGAHPTVPSEVLTTEKVAIVTASESEEPTTEAYVTSTTRVDEKVVTVLPEAPTTATNVEKEDTTAAEASTIHQTQSELTTKSSIDVTATEHIPVDVSPEDENAVTKVPSQITTESLVTEQQAAATEQPSVVSPNEPHVPVVILPGENQPNVPEGTTEKQLEQEVTKQPEQTPSVTENVATTEKSETEYVPPGVIDEAQATTKHPEVSTTEEPDTEEEGVLHGDPHGEDHPEQVTESDEDDGVPGEGKCLVEGQTYSNNSNVPPINHCQTSCKCVSSILQCESVICSPAPSNFHNCMPLYKSPDSCCPTYSCSISEKPEIESDSHKMDDHTTQSPTQKPVQEVTEKESNAVPELPETTNLVPDDENTIQTGVPQHSTEIIPVEIITEGHKEPEIQVTERIDLNPEVPTENVPVKEEIPTSTSSPHVVTEDDSKLNTVPNTDNISEEPQHPSTAIEQGTTEGVPQKEYTTQQNIPEVTEPADNKQTDQSPSQVPEVSVEVTEPIEHSTAHVSEQTEKQEPVTESVSTSKPVELQPTEGSTEKSDTSVEVTPEIQVTEILPQEHSTTSLPEHISEGQSTETATSDNNEVTNEIDSSSGKPATEPTAPEHSTNLPDVEKVTEAKPSVESTETLPTDNELEQPQVTEINIHPSESTSALPEQQTESSSVSNETPSISVTQKLPVDSPITAAPEKEVTVESQQTEFNEVNIPETTQNIEIPTDQPTQSTESVPVHVTEVSDSTPAQTEADEKPTSSSDQPEDITEHGPVTEKVDHSTSSPVDEPKITTVGSEIVTTESGTEYVPKEPTTHHEEHVTESHITNEIPQYTEHTVKPSESESTEKVPVEEGKLDDKKHTTQESVVENVTTEGGIHEVSSLPELTTKLAESQVTEEQFTEKITTPHLISTESPITEKIPEVEKPEQQTEQPKQPSEAGFTLPVVIVEQTTPHHIIDEKLSTEHPSQITEEHKPLEQVTEIPSVTGVPLKPLDQATEKIPEERKPEQVTDAVPQTTELTIKPLDEVTEKVPEEQKPEEQVPVTTGLPLKPTEGVTEKVTEEQAPVTTGLPLKPTEAVTEKVTEEQVPVTTDVPVKPTEGVKVPEEQAPVTTDLPLKPTEKVTEEQAPVTTDLPLKPSDGVTEEQAPVTTDLPLKPTEKVTEEQSPVTTDLPLKPTDGVTEKVTEEQAPVTTEVPIKSTEKVSEERKPEEAITTEIPFKPSDETTENAPHQEQTSVPEVTESVLVEQPTKQPEVALTDAPSSTEQPIKEHDQTPEDQVTNEIPHSTEKASQSSEQTPDHSVTTEAVPETVTSVKPSEPEVTEKLPQPEEKPAENVSESVTEHSTKLPVHQTEPEIEKETEKGQESGVTEKPHKEQEPVEHHPEEVTKDDDLYTSGPAVTYPTVSSVAGELFTSDSITKGPDANHTEEITTPSIQYPATTEQVTESSSLVPEVPEHTPEVPDYHLPNEEDYGEEDPSGFGPGTCRYGGKFYVSAQQIPRDDPCDFCFCFRSDIICLQQSCPPPIPRCHEEPIRGFCCPRYECPVSMATSLNYTTTTTTTTTTLPPHFFSHAYKGRAKRQGCQVQGKSYQVGEEIASASGPCLQCTCGGDGQMKCDPKVCSPEPMLRKMIAEVASRRRR